MQNQSFLDISMSFQNNPLNKDLISLKNKTAISRSVRNLVLTLRGERFYDSLKGSRVNQLLFDNLDELNSVTIEDEIRDVLTAYEPRIVLDSVRVIPNYDNHEYNITISYTIIGTSAPQNTLTFALSSVR